MPSDPTPTPPPGTPGKQRRRPGPPGMGGNMIWLVVLAILVGWFLVQQVNPAGTLEWGEFYKLLETKNLKKVILIGHERITGEVKDLNDPSLPPDLKAKMEKAKANGRFAVQRPQIDDAGDLNRRLAELVKD